ncbi:unnamed protein product [Somion occarium]|uniref:F-box domain-containing protein n=1 Tax=Somion occarium TaxID=3059160 RepID=A0ABP1DUG7_9APHY
MTPFVIPIELLEDIVDAVKHQTEHTPTLNNLSLTCRGLLYRSRSYTFRVVKIRNASRLNLLIELLQANPNLSCFIRILEVHEEVPRTLFTRLLIGRWPNLLYLQLYSDAVLYDPQFATSLRAGFSSIKILSLSVDLPADKLLQVLECLPNLRCLRMDNATCYGPIGIPTIQMCLPTLACLQYIVQSSESALEGWRYISGWILESPSSLMHLKVLQLSIHDNWNDREADLPSVSALLEACGSSLEELWLSCRHNRREESPAPDLSVLGSISLCHNIDLRRLSLQLDFHGQRNMTGLFECLSSVKSPVLEHLHIQIDVVSTVGGVGLDLWKELDDMLNGPHFPSLTSVNIRHFSRDEETLRSYLPSLQSRGILTIDQVHETPVNRWIRLNGGSK